VVLLAKGEYIGRRILSHPDLVELPHLPIVHKQEA